MPNRPILSAQEVRQAINGEADPTSRIPMFFHFWTHPFAYGEREPEIVALLEEYPYDAMVVSPMMPGYAESYFADHPGYVWIPSAKNAKEKGSLDARQYITDWDNIDKIIDELPDPELPWVMDEAKKAIAKDDTGRYRLGYFWYLYYERFWSFRGMENALVDFYEHPEEVHKLFAALTRIYVVYVRRLKEECNCDGLFVTDDLGTQTGLMFSPALFKEFFAPYYKQVIDECHRQGMHFWFHTCGNVTDLLDDFISLGMDVIHPIQKYSMSETATAQRFGDKICFLAGMDVQQIMPHGTTEDVRREVRFMIDTYARPGGGLMLTLGNGVTPDIPIENLRAMMDEAYRYGMARGKKNA